MNGNAKPAAKKSRRPQRKPDPWQEHQDPSSGDTFYVNVETGETAWYRPGWTRVVDEGTGEPYWYNFETNETALYNPEDLSDASDASDGEAGGAASGGEGAQMADPMSEAGVTVASPTKTAQYAFGSATKEQMEREWGTGRQRSRSSSSAGVRGKGKYVDISSDEEPEAPGAPSDVRAEAGDATATVSWRAPRSDGGADLLSYTVKVRPHGAFMRVPSDRTEATATGLANGVSTTFVVAAETRAGVSADSEPSKPVVPAGPPNPPTDVHGAPADRAVDFAWRPPFNVNGADVDAYVVTPSVPGMLPQTVEVDGVDESGHVKYRLQGLSNGEPITATVQAVNRAGASVPSEPSEPIVPAGPPPAPVITDAAPGDESAHVVWEAPDGNGAPVIHYEVVPSPAPKDYAPVIVRAPRTECDMPGLPNGTGVAFTVSAANKAGTGRASRPSKSVVPAGRPPAPRKVEAEPGDKCARVSWSPPEHTNGSPITSYVVTSNHSGVAPVEVATSRSGAAAAAAAGVGSARISATVKGLPNGASSVFTVVAVNALGEGAASEPSDAIVPAGPPSAPEHVSATAGDSQVSVTWSPTVDMGGTEVTHYEVVCTSGGAASMTVPAKRLRAVMTDGVKNGTRYRFAVAAINAVGRSELSEPCGIVHPAGPPGPPTGLVATPRNHGVDVTFKAPESDNGDKVESYVVTAVSGGHGASVNVRADARPLVAAFEHLRNGARCTFSAVAVNSVGSSEASEVSKPVVPAGPPGKPRNVVCTPRPGGAVVRFMAHKDSGGLALTSFTVTLTPGGAKIDVPAPAGETVDDKREISGTVNGLANGTSYVARVVAHNPLGTSEPSEASPPVVPCGTPSAPRAVAVSAGNAAIEVGWQAPADDGGKPVTGYVVSVAPPQAGLDPVRVDAGATSVELTGVKNGRTVAVSVVAVNDAGAGDAAVSDKVTPSAEPPHKPVAVSAEPGDRSATVSWTAPELDGGAPVSAYIVTCSPGGAEVEVSAPGTTASVAGLRNGEPYTFTVMAVNEAGRGPASTASDIVRPAGLPGAPTDVAAVPGNHQAVVTWRAPADDGGAELLEYTVSASASEVPPVKVPAGSTATTIRGLMNEDPVCFTVTAANRVGSGKASLTSEMVTPKGPKATPPTPPSMVRAEPLDKSVRVTWAQPTDNGGGVVTGYTVAVTPGGRTVEIADGPSGTAAVITGLDNGSPYTFTVTAANRVGASDASAPSAPSVPAGPAAAPGNVVVAPNDCRVVVTWEAPADSNGADITRYVVAAEPVDSDGGGASAGAGAGAGAGAAAAAGDKATSHAHETTTPDATCRAVIRDLVNGQPVRVTVMAITSAGRGLPSAAVQATPAGPASAPRDVTVEGGKGSATLTWKPPLNDGGSRVAKYTVALAPGDGKDAQLAEVPPTDVAAIAGADTITATVTGLTNDVAVAFVVAAVTSAGPGHACKPTREVTPTVPFDEQIADATALLAGGGADRAEAALGAFERLASKPEARRRPEVAVGRGNALKVLDRPNDALAAFDAALVADAGHAPAHLGRAAVLDGMGKTQEALQAAKRAARGDPSLFEAHRLLATLYGEKGDSANALAAAEECLRVRPGDAPSLLDKGCALLELDRSKEAIQALEACMAAGLREDEDAQNSYVAALEGAAEEAQENGDAAGAASFLRKIVEYRPTPEARISLAESLLVVGQHDEALALFEAVLEDKPGNFHAVAGKGRIMLKKGRYDDAVVSLRKAKAMNDTDAQVHADLGVALLRTGNLPSAERILNKALALRSGLPDAKAALDELNAAKQAEKASAGAERHTSAGDRMLSEGKFAEAAKSYATARSQGASGVDLDLHHAQACTGTGDFGAATVMWQAVLDGIKKDPRRVLDEVETTNKTQTAYEGLAHCHAMAGEHAKALAVAEQGLKLRTTSSARATSGTTSLLCECGDALAALKRPQEALKRYQQAVKLNPASTRANAGVSATEAAIKRGAAPAAGAGVGAGAGAGAGAGEGAGAGAAAAAVAEPAPAAAASEAAPLVAKPAPEAAKPAPAVPKPVPAKPAAAKPVVSAPKAVKPPPPGVKAPPGSAKAPAKKAPVAPPAGVKAPAKTTAVAPPSGVKPPAKRAPVAPPAGVRAPAKTPPVAPPAGVKAPAKTAPKPVPKGVVPPPGVRAATASSSGAGAGAGADGGAASSADPARRKTPPGVRVGKAPAGVKAPAKPPPGVAPPPGTRKPSPSGAKKPIAPPPGVKNTASKPVPSSSMPGVRPPPGRPAAKATKAVRAPKAPVRPPPGVRPPPRP